MKANVKIVKIDREITMINCHIVLKYHETQEPNLWNGIRGGGNI